MYISQIVYIRFSSIYFGVILGWYAPTQKSHCHYCHSLKGTGRPRDSGDQTEKILRTEEVPLQPLGNSPALRLSPPRVRGSKRNPPVEHLMMTFKVKILPLREALEMESGRVPR